MSIFSIFTGKKSELPVIQQAELPVIQQDSITTDPNITVKAEGESLFGRVRQSTVTAYFDGEQNAGMLGTPVDYIFDYQNIRARGWKVYHDSAICQTFINNYVQWVCGAGLKIQCEPNVDVIKQFHKDFDKKKFVNQAEGRFRLHANSKHSTVCKTLSLSKQYPQAVLTACVGGDCLIINRVVNNTVKTDLVDGRLVTNPHDAGMLLAVEERGNRLYEGVEFDENGTHIAFYVLKSDGTHNRIEAYGAKTGRLQAFLLYATHHRAGDVRGLPMHYASIEMLTNMDKLIGACVSGAVKAANYALVVEHNHFSTGESIAIQGMAEAIGSDLLKQQQEDVAVNLKTNATASGVDSLIELPIGATVKTMPATSNTNIGPFVETAVMFYGASMGMPYEMATMVFKNSFSASRMSSQSFQQILNNMREMYSDYYQVAYSLYLEIEVLLGNVEAPGYLEAIMKNDYIMVEAYISNRYLGPRVPQADPSKEIKSAILAIQHGIKTHEQAADENGGGDYSTNVLYLGEEYELMQKYIPKEYQLPTNAETSTAEFGKEPKTKEKTVKEPK